MFRKSTLSILANIKFRFFVCLAILITLAAGDVLSQVYEMSLSQRRRFDQIHVEIWAKSTDANSPELGYASLVVQYNTTFLQPAASQNLSMTDTVNVDVNQVDPIDTLNSQFNSSNGYSALGSQNYGTGYYSLEVNLSQLGTLGVVPFDSGRGSFIGKLIFDIIDNPSTTDLTAINWSQSTFPGDVRVFDADSNDIETSVTFVTPGDFTVTGFTILNPDQEGQVVDMDLNYASLTGDYAAGGYPIYFERSVNPTEFDIPGITPPALDEDLAYLIEYSNDDGTNWSEIGRVAESDRSSTITGSSSAYRTGNIFNPSTTSSYVLSSKNGEQITIDNYREPVRVIWSKNPNFPDRSEQARLRITSLGGVTENSLQLRSTTTQFDISDDNFILGRLFFVQLNGTDEYYKTENNYSNSTQLTVETWINLNTVKAEGSETGVVVHSGGPDAQPINGSTEGAWMLYLTDGGLPSFRVRENSGRGTNGYIAQIVARDPLVAVSDAEPLVVAHSENWAHLAATVADNVVTLYVNGEIVDRVTNDVATDIRMLITNHPIWVGLNPNGEIDETDYLNAGLKGTRVWRVALSQDEIRERVAGVVNPDDVSTYGDLRRALQQYYSFEGSKADLADDETYQNGEEILNRIVTAGTDNDNISFRPDKPHIKLTAPAAGVGVNNTTDDKFQVRWVSYGMGDIENAGTNDVELEFSLDGGSTWDYAKDSLGTDYTGEDAPDVEFGSVTWAPYLNSDLGFDLTASTPFDKTVNFRIRGTESNTQDDLNNVTGDFSVAKFFALQKTENTIIIVPSDNAMNITGNTAYMEAWIRPYRFPTDDEAFFPIFSKYDSVNTVGHYDLRLLTTGQLQLTLTDDQGVERIATSDINNPIIRPNSVALDSVWTHIGVYVFLNDGTGATEVRFFIDGFVQDDATLTSQLGENLSLITDNQYPLYIGYFPNGGNADPNGFVGELRELRFWNGTPNGTAASGTEPTEMTLFVQGAQAVKATDLLNANQTNLYAAYSMNGSGFVNGGYNNSVPGWSGSSDVLRVYAGSSEYKATRPYIKLVEPAFNDEIANSKEDVRVRWVGFDYDGEGFRAGTTTLTPSLEFSLLGGGGQEIQPYQYVGSLYWTGNTENSISYPISSDYLFDGTGNNVIYALEMNASIADPDEDNDGSFDQGPLSASLSNARLRLTGQYTINEGITEIQSEGPLFTVTPASNFTVRMLLEGYHDGDVSGSDIRDLATAYANGGVKIWIFADNVGTVGALLDSAESTSGYVELDPSNRDGNNNRFANVNFVFTELADGNYWVVVDHLNHLPVMSRYAAPFQYIGDTRSTWEIESGWDFTSWDGVDDNILPNATTDPYSGGYYTAYGNAKSTTTEDAYSTTGLIFNNGVAGGISDAMSALVGGDVTNDGQINAADRVRVRVDEGTSLVRSDVTGDGFVNADDRTITDRNFGKVSSIYDVTFPSGFSPLIINNSNPFGVIAKEDKELSIMLNTQALAPEKADKSNAYEILGSVRYEVTGEPQLNGDFVDLALYIKNMGPEFGLANCTFAVKYSSSDLSYADLIGEENVIFHDKPDVGYAFLTSAPEAGVSKPIPEVRTIEVDYDAFANLGGVSVPYEKTYLGTLRFKLKRRDNIVKFEWHESNAVHSTDERLVTPDGDFKEIKALLLYNALLETPNGGETFGQKRNTEIKWNSQGTAKVNIEFSSDGGNSWTQLNTDPVNVSDLTFDWTTPNISSSVCLIRILDAETNIELDRSNNVFAIQANFAQIVKPSSGDPIYYGGTTADILWNSKGYDFVRFEFSSDGGSTWQSVSAKVSATKQTISWKVPRVTTKNAKIRMIDSETEEEASISTVFKVLDGSMEFRNPRPGEVLIVDRVTRIRWNSEYVESFDMDLSIDGGTTWERLQSSVNPAKGNREWQVPNKETDRAIIRAIWNGDAEMEYARTGLFEITAIGGVQEIIPEGYQLGQVYPNPASGEIKMDVVVLNTEIVNAKIFNVAGEMKLMEIGKQITSGNPVYSMNVESLDAGHYYMVIESENLRVFRRFIIRK